MEAIITSTILSRVYYVHTAPLSPDGAGPTGMAGDQEQAAEDVKGSCHKAASGWTNGQESYAQVLYVR